MRRKSRSKKKMLFVQKNLKKLIRKNKSLLKRLKKNLSLKKVQNVLLMFSLSVLKLNVKLPRKKKKLKLNIIHIEEEEESVVRGTSWNGASPRPYSMPCFCRRKVQIWGVM